MFLLMKRFQSVYKSEENHESLFNELYFIFIEGILFYYF